MEVGIPQLGHLVAGHAVQGVFAVCDQRGARTVEMGVVRAKDATHGASKDL